MITDGLKPYLCSKSSSTDPRQSVLDTECAWLQPFFGALGCASAIVFTTFGAAYGTAKAGVGICSSGILRPDLIVKSKFWREGQALLQR